MRCRWFASARSTVHNGTRKFRRALRICSEKLAERRRDSRVVATWTLPSRRLALLFVTQFSRTMWRDEMLKKLMMTTAALTLLTGSAFAQAPEQPKMQPSTPAPSATTPAPSAQNADKAKFVTQQAA